MPGQPRDTGQLETSKLARQRVGRTDCSAPLLGGDAPVEESVPVEFDDTEPVLYPQADPLPDGGGARCSLVSGRFV